MAHRMDTLLDDFNKLSDVKQFNPFKKFGDFSIGTKFNVYYFSRYRTRFHTVIVAHTDDYKLILPYHLEQFFDSDDELNEWNAKRNLKLRYNGIVNNTVLIGVSVSKNKKRFKNMLGVGIKFIRKILAPKSCHLRFKFRYRSSTTDKPNKFENEEKSHRRSSCKIALDFEAGNKEID